MCEYQRSHTFTCTVKIPLTKTLSYALQGHEKHSNIRTTKSSMNTAVLGCAMGHMTWEGCDCVEHGSTYGHGYTGATQQKSLFAVHYQ